MDTKGTTMTDESRPASPTRNDLSKAVDASIVATKRFARTLSRGFLGFGIVAAIMIFVAATRHSSNSDLDSDLDTSTNVGIACVVLFFMGMLPALAARWLVMRDVGPVRWLVRDGEIYPARVVRRDLRSFRGGASHIVVAWHDSQREHRAHFDVDRLEDTIAPGTAVVVKGKRGPAVAYINGKLFVARRVR